MANPAWRTKKIPHAENLRREIDNKKKEIRDLEIEVAKLKNILEEVEASELPILLYVCCYKDNESGRWDYDHLYYIPDLKRAKLDRVTRCIHFGDENLLLPNVLDLRSTFKNCGFPEEITSTAPDFWELKQRNQPKVDKAVKQLETVIDFLFESKEIESWGHLRRCLTDHFHH